LNDGGPAWRLARNISAAAADGAQLVVS